MYNRYIQQSDGSFRRNRVSEPNRQQPPKRPAPPPEPPKREPECETPKCEPACETTKCEPSCSAPPPPRPEPRQAPKQQPCAMPSTGAGTFLRGLLPKNLDTGDLLVILLILLIAGDCPSDRNNALLTLALYLFL